MDSICITSGFNSEYLTTIIELDSHLSPILGLASQSIKIGKACTDAKGNYVDCSIQPDELRYRTVFFNKGGSTYIQNINPVPAINIYEMSYKDMKELLCIKNIGIENSSSESIKIDPIRLFSPMYSLSDIINQVEY